MCVCGHGRPSHGTTGWPRFEPVCNSRTCCDVPPRRHPGQPDSHDFANHPGQWCTCKQYTEQPTQQGA
jgi:hypothetical protein